MNITQGASIVQWIKEVVVFRQRLANTKILDILDSYGPMSGVEIEGRTGLSNGLVSKGIRMLLEQGLIEESVHPARMEDQLAKKTYGKARRVPQRLGG